MIGIKGAFSFRADRMSVSALVAVWERCDGKSGGDACRYQG